MCLFMLSMELLNALAFSYFECMFDDICVSTVLGKVKNVWGVY